MLNSAQRKLFLIVALAVLAGRSMAQGVDTYVRQMNNAFAPLGTVKGTDCRHITFESEGPWMDTGLPDGIDPQTHEPTWTVIRLDVLRVSADLTSLNEDKVKAMKLYSLYEIKKHRSEGLRNTPTTPAVLISALPSASFESTIVDLDKADQYLYATNVPESDLGATQQQ